MNIKLNLIVAVSENMGIGLNGDLPWRLRKELAHFSRLTKRTIDCSKQNAVIMGRRTWESIPEKNRPLPGRLNIVLTKQELDFGKEVLVCNSLNSALQKLHKQPLDKTIESVWVIGGSSVYKEAMSSPHCHRIYLTKIFKTFECDTFLPEVPANSFKVVRDPDVVDEVQEENGLAYEYQVPVPKQTSQMIGWRSSQRKLIYDTTINQFQKKKPLDSYMCYCRVGYECICPDNEGLYSMDEEEPK